MKSALHCQCFKNMSKRSRTTRMKAVIEELSKLSQEYETWLNRVPENLMDTEVVEQLEETINDIDEVLEILSGTTLPLGFGR